MKTIRVLGLPVTVFEGNIENEIMQVFHLGKPVAFHGYSIDTLYLMKTIQGLYQMRMINDFFLCDGRGYYYFMKLLGVKGIKKLSLPSLTMMMLSIASKYGKSIYILGATPDSNLKAVEVLTTTHGVKKVFGRNGYFTTDDEIDVVEEINRSKPDILLLGMSSPKKDEFVYKWKQSLNVKAIVHCGGMIDVISGKTRLYPKWVKDLCLAAVYRVVQEPIRLRRDINNAFKSIFLIIGILIRVKIFGQHYNFPLRHNLDTDVEAKL